MQLAPGQLTQAFQAASSNRTTPNANSTAITKDTAATHPLSKKGNQNARKSTVVSCTPTAGIPSMQFSNSSSGTGVSTRASGRVTRASELRAVKLDSAGLTVAATA